MVEADSRILAAVLTGVNRAFPYVAAEDVDRIVEEHTPALFKMVHASSFNVGVQALALLHQILSAQAAMSGRYYRALFAVLLSPALARSSKAAMFLGLLVKALKADLDGRRIAAFVKRLLQVAFQQPPQFACGSLIIVSELLKHRPTLWRHVLQSEDHPADDEEHFEDLSEDETSPRADALADTSSLDAAVYANGVSPSRKGGLKVANGGEVVKELTRGEGDGGEEGDSDEELPLKEIHFNEDDENEVDDEDEEEEEGEGEGRKDVSKKRRRGEADDEDVEDEEKTSKARKRGKGGGSERGQGRNGMVEKSLSDKSLIRTVAAKEDGSVEEGGGGRYGGGGRGEDEDEGGHTRGGKGEGEEVNGEAREAHRRRQDARRAEQRALWPVPGGYDMKHRDPAFCHGDLSCWWELSAMAAHVHPSVAAMARTLLAGTHVSYSGDPLRDMSLGVFLDRFAEKKPKARQAKGRAAEGQEGGGGDDGVEAGGGNMNMRGISLMQPLQAPGKGVAKSTLQIGSEAFAALSESQVAAEDAFFHKYFAAKAAKKDKKQKQPSARDEANDDDGVEESDEDEEEEDALAEEEGEEDSEDSDSEEAESGENDDEDGTLKEGKVLRSKKRVETETEGTDDEDDDDSENEEINDMLDAELAEEFDMDEEEDEEDEEESDGEYDYSELGKAMGLGKSSGSGKAIEAVSKQDLAAKKGKSGRAGKGSVESKKVTREGKEGEDEVELGKGVGKRRGGLEDEEEDDDDVLDDSDDADDVDEVTFMDFGDDGPDDDDDDDGDDVDDDDDDDDGAAGLEAHEGRQKERKDGISLLKNNKKKSAKASPFASVEDYAHLLGDDAPSEAFDGDEGGKGRGEGRRKGRGGSQTRQPSHDSKQARGRGSRKPGHS
eukprot:TRINITY_DN50_c2_g1_i1.p1 TRINITY_DN50_c2_g1~~TRINITY_DN50_c2_g1_i1.p1  ORF type:complete len:923 (+),score=335.80 TRINITY_DN50_c2_g1_i1:103-2769(+)